MAKITFVYFDVGGVIVKDFSQTDNWTRLKAVLQIPTEQEEKFDELYDKYEEQMCLGVDDQIFLSKFRNQLNIHFPAGFSFTKYIVDNFRHNPDIYPIVSLVASQTKIGLLTDMYKGMRTYMLERGLFPNISWDVILDSSELGLKKPMPEIYQLATTRSGAAPSEILFIDNREKNLVPARQLGWQTFLYDSSNYDQSNAKLATFLNLQLPGL